MIGPMKKKVIMSAVLTAVALVVFFGVIAGVYVAQTNRTIAKLKTQGEVVERYVFSRDMTAGDVVTASDVLKVNVKGESAPTDSYTELDSLVGRRLKVNAGQRTIAIGSLFFEDDKAPALDTRLQEFNMIKLPSDLLDGDFIDVRILFPGGEDYSVIVGKKVEALGATEAESNTIFLRLNEEEINRISCAIIESYMRDGVLLYANKYVDPSTQLYDYARIDFVERFEANRYSEQTEATYDESGELLTEGTKVERTIPEIAVLIGLDTQETENIKLALDTSDAETLKYYRNKLVVTDKSIVANYPVKPEVATLIASNPNILVDIRAKYNVSVLEQQRVNLLGTSLTKYDPYTGETTEDEAKLKSISEKLKVEIEAQRTERQQYLLNLLAYPIIEE